MLQLEHKSNKNVKQKKRLSGRKKSGYLFYACPVKSISHLTGACPVKFREVDYLTGVIPATCPPKFNEGWKAGIIKKINRRKERVRVKNTKKSRVREKTKNRPGIKDGFFKFKISIRLKQPLLPLQIRLLPGPRQSFYHLQTTWVYRSLQATGRRKDPLLQCPFFRRYPNTD